MIRCSVNFYSSFPSKRRLNKFGNSSTELELRLLSLVFIFFSINWLYVTIICTTYLLKANNDVQEQDIEWVEVWF